MSEERSKKGLFKRQKSPARKLIFVAYCKKHGEFPGRWENGDTCEELILAAHRRCYSAPFRVECCETCARVKTPMYTGASSSETLCRSRETKSHAQSSKIHESSFHNETATINHYFIVSRMRVRRPQVLVWPDRKQTVLLGEDPHRLLRNLQAL